MKLTLLRSTNYSHVHCLCKNTSLTTVIKIAYQRRSLCWLTWHTNSFLAYYCCTYVTTIEKPFVHCLTVFVILVISMYCSRQKTTEKSLYGQHHSDKVVLFEHNSHTPGWTAVLWSGEGWLKAFGEPCSIKLVSITFCERSTWILRFCDAWLLGIVMSVQVSRFTAQFCKYTERFDLKAI